MGKPKKDNIPEAFRQFVMDLDEVTLDPDNARAHPRKNIDGLKASLEDHGQVKLSVVYRQAGAKKIVVAGNGLVMAARELGWTKLAMVKYQGLKKAAKAYGLTDNKTALESQWDNSTLARVLGDLREEGFDLGRVGWTQPELAKLLPTTAKGPVAVNVSGLTRPDGPDSVEGECYQLGPHLLICGDATDEELWSENLPQGIDALWTDSPYGVDYRGVRDERGDEAIANDSDVLEAVQVAQAAITLAVRWLKAGGACYVAAPSGNYLWRFGRFADQLGIWRQTIAWCKEHFVTGRQDYHNQWEPILYGWKPGAPRYFTADRSQSTVFRTPLPRNSKLHPTQKPVALVEEHLRNSTLEGQIVVDPFLGSGTTLIAAARLSRVCVGFELDPGRCDLIRERWHAWATGAGEEPGTGALEPPNE